MCIEHLPTVCFIHTISFNLPNNSEGRIQPMMT